MMRAVGTIALCAAALATATPALAEATRKSTLKIVIVVDDLPKGATLTCDPDGGSHPTPAAACDLLRKVKGDPSKLNVVPNPVCTDEYQPHTVVVVGKWRGTSLRWTYVFSNSCRMKAAGGAVFTIRPPAA
ncbi:SSI family serine proteinase inhibitor [Nonomuraea sp. NPDC049158]|uniref:SSI family serine proteinase inhibitor n=1 Tax=Nonomuraea sp. NPDC049158 TaxID=3155649 RepID=UPI00340DD8FA